MIGRVRLAFLPLPVLKDSGVFLPLAGLAGVSQARKVKILAGKKQVFRISAASLEKLGLEKRGRGFGTSEEMREASWFPILSPRKRKQLDVLAPQPHFCRF